MIKLFETFNDYNHVKTWLNSMGIYNYTINEDLTVDVNGDVNLNNIETVIPIQFGKVSGDFLYRFNRITTLKGCPIEVGGDFNCSTNWIESLIDSPVKKVGGSFACRSNKLTSLEGCPIEVGGAFSVTENKLTSLINSPNYVGGEFYIHNNPLPREINFFEPTCLLIMHQEDYGIWNTDGSLNKGRFNIFLRDFEAGILKEEQK